MRDRWLSRFTHAARIPQHPAAGAAGEKNTLRALDAYTRAR
jgi:hypothetical protein